MSADPYRGRRVKHGDGALGGHGGARVQEPWAYTRPFFSLT
jgi:hypothetical protein